MKKLYVLLIPILLLTLTSCSEYKYRVISENKVDGYNIYAKVPRGGSCEAYFEDIYYSDEEYNYGYGYSGCSEKESFFIRKDGNYVYLRDALEDGDITLDNLIKELKTFDRYPEEVNYEVDDYYYLDFYIDGNPLYIYAGGVCDMMMTETYEYNGEDYHISASGCLKDRILFIEINGEFLSVKDLVDEGVVDISNVIPVLFKTHTPES